MKGVFGDPDVMRFGDGVKTEPWIREWLRRCLEHYQVWGFGLYALVEKTTHHTVGYCGLLYFADIAGRPEVEIGYRLAKRYWHQGYATEAALAVRDYGFNVLGLRRLVAMIDPANLASIGVAEKLGMSYEKDVTFEGYTHPDHLYVMANSTFEKGREEEN